MTPFRRIVLATTLALGLAACGGDADEAPPAAEPVAAVAAPDGQAWSDTVSVTQQGGWKVGNPEAPISLVEYGSLTCPACAAFSQEGMQPLIQNYIGSGRVSYEFRSVPIHGAIDLLLTRLLECGPKEAAVPLAEQLWGNLDQVIGGAQANPAGLERAMSLPNDQRFVAYADAAGLYDFFSARGVSVDQARQCLSDFGAIQSLAERMQGQADTDEVTGTPTFFLNGRRIDGTRWVDVEPALQNAGAR